MLVVGKVMRVRDGQYLDKRTNKPVLLKYVDVFDDSVGLLNCSMKVDGQVSVPIDGDSIMGEVIFLRPLPFRGAIGVTLGKIDYAAVGAVPGLPKVNPSGKN